MSDHRARISWKLSGADFSAGKYSREHTWTFDGGLTLPASPSPAIVPAPYSNASSVDPEEAFVASISSCHMLTFVHLASREGLEVLSYEDEAVGKMAKNEAGARWVSLVTLSPSVEYARDKAPSPEQEQRLHHRAHQECFIANSVKTEIAVAPNPSVRR